MKLFSSFCFIASICLSEKVYGILQGQAHFCCNRNPPCFVTPDICFQGRLARSVLFSSFDQKKNTKS